MVQETPDPAAVEDALASVAVEAASFHGRPAVAVGYPRETPDGRGGTLRYRCLLVIVDGEGGPVAASGTWPEGMALGEALARLPARLLGLPSSGRLAYLAAVSGTANGSCLAAGISAEVAVRVESLAALKIREAMGLAGFRGRAMAGLEILGRRHRRPPYEAAGPYLDAGPGGDRLRAFATAYPAVAELWEDAVAARALTSDVELADVHPSMTPAMAARVEAAGAAEVVAWDRGGLSLAGFLPALPLDWFPRGREQGESLGKVASVITSFWMEASPDMSMAAFREMVDPSKGDWSGFWRRCVANAPAGMSDDCHGLGTFVSDLPRAFARHVVMPLQARERGDDAVSYGRAYNAAVILLYGRKGLPGRIELSAWWHAHMAEVNAAMPADADAGGAWPALSGTVRAGGLDIVPLTSAAALEWEGGDGPDPAGADGLDHCVASYRHDAFRGEIHILSVREPLPGGGYRRVATAEVAFDGERRLGLRQLMGLGNSTPDERACRAMEAYLATPHAYVAPREPDPGQVVREACGYDWRDPALVERALAAYGPLLPRWLRGQGADVVAMACDLRDLPPWMAEGGLEAA